MAPHICLARLPANLREPVLTAYDEALRKMFQIDLIISCLTVPGAVLLKWRRILKKPKENIGAETSEAGKKKNVEETTEYVGRKHQRNLLA